MKTDPTPPVATLLIVDDAPANLELLVGLFQAKGFRVFPVPSGERALRAARHEPPDLILLDINMPGMDGYEVCRCLKADPALRAIPVIFISALDGVIDKVKAFGVGGVDYVGKPFQFEEVEARVNTHLELARLRGELERHNAQLEETVARRTRELAAANARLAVLDQAKSDFLRLISHEVRTPLNGVFGAAELLLATYSEDPAVAQYSEIYEISRRRLLTLIDDALLLSQIGLDTAEGAPPCCRLSEVLARACADARPLAQTRGVQLAPVPGDLGQVQGTPDYLARALQSLVETALKFARAGTTVRLTPSSAPGAICLRIEAEGQVLPVEALPRFFDLLVIANPIAGVDDLGLAPALAERIVTLSGGAVAVENLDPPGLRLSVRLKASEPAAS